MKLFQQGDYPGAITKYEEARAEGRQLAGKQMTSADIRQARQVEGAVLGSLGATVLWGLEHFCLPK